MCGIAGYWHAGGLEGAPVAVQAMMDAIAHRGPDAEGSWSDPEAGIAVGHRRLSIIDLSSAGSQPMLSADGRLVISYNGEIYNHLELRARLEAEHRAPNWRGHSDTETLVAGISAWGLEVTLRRANGMFAFALWDRRRRTLQLARDRFGEKPLYYGLAGKTLLFGSELKALRRHPAWNGVIDRAGLVSLMRKGYVEEPLSIFESVRKLPPGSWIEFASPSGDAAPVAYFDALATARQAFARRVKTAPDQLIASFTRALADAVNLRMMADVPVGAFLSGGYDSAAVVAMMQRRAARPVRTFTIGFRESGFDEAPHAEAVARHLGTDHTTLYVEPKDTLDVVPRLPEIWDEPFADPSQIPTYLVAKLTRQFVTVSLSGDGADEMLGGYNRYRGIARRWRQLAVWPHALRRPAASLLRAIALRAQGDMIAAPDAMALYEHRFARWKGATANVLGTKCPAPRATSGVSADVREQAMVRDAIDYLPGDILAKVDRASMACSLETRIPFLDPDVAALCWSLPIEMKIRNGTGKWLLREAVHRIVPKDLMDRPKHGFSAPIAAWLRGPLRPWAEDLLSESQLAAEGYFSTAPIRSLWRSHLEGRSDGSKRLWCVLMFQAWRRHWRE
jgi:asparagine synthase (glutamine-hydrolysing)